MFTSPLRPNPESLVTVNESCALSDPEAGVAAVNKVTTAAKSTIQQLRRDVGSGEDVLTARGYVSFIKMGDAALEKTSFIQNEFYTPTPTSVAGAGLVPVLLVDVSGWIVVYFPIASLNRLVTGTPADVLDSAVEKLTDVHTRAACASRPRLLGPMDLGVHSEQLEGRDGSIRVWVARVAEWTG